MPAPRLRAERLEDRSVPAAVGALDPSFGAAGVASAAFTTISAFNEVVTVQPDGKIVLAGTHLIGTPTRGFVARFNPDGTPDPTFGGGDGVLDNIAFGGGLFDDSSIAGVAVQADGRVVVVGTFGFPVIQQTAVMVVARLKLDGSGLDPTFSGDGISTIDLPGGGDNGAAVAIRPNGRIVAVGTNSIGNLADFTVAQLDPATGELDPGFGGGDGVLDEGFGGNDFAAAVTILPDGRIVAVGRTDETAGTPDDFAVMMVRADGSGLDPAFDADGELVIGFGSDDEALVVRHDAAGRIVVAGTVDTPGEYFTVVRLDPTGAFDTSFGGGDGVASVPLGATARLSGMDFDPAGRITLAGRINAGGTPNNLAVVRLTELGVNDPTFGTDGVVTVDLPDPAAAGAAFVTNNGRVLVATSTGTGANVRPALVRLIGGVEKPTAAVAGGPADGAVAVLFPDGAGKLTASAAATAAFGGGSGAPRVATADVNGDGTDDAILVTGPGVPIRVTVVSGVDQKTVLVAAFDPFPGSNFTGGGYVAAGDFDNDGRAEFVVTPDEGGGPVVAVYARTADGTAAELTRFNGIDDPNFRGGARAAVGDVNGDGVADLAVAAGFGGGPRIALFDGKTALTKNVARLVGDFFAFPGADAVSLRNGSFVAIGDVSGDGFADLVFGGGPGGAPRVFVLSGALIAAGNVDGAYAAPVLNFFVAGNEADRGGVRVAAADLDGDAKADILAASGEGRPAGLRSYLGKDVTASTEPAAFQDVALFGAAALPGGVFVG